MRLQKFLALAGVASRRKSEELILQGRVQINGKTVSELGVKVTDKDLVELDGKKITVEDQKIYIMLNKPEGCVTTAKDQFGRPTVMDFIEGIDERLYPVGRLDYHTSGLLLLTNDGEFTHLMTHPSHEIEKVYVAEVEGCPDEKEIDMLRKGVDIGGFVTSPAKVEITEKKKNSCILKIAIHEGKNRQVRRMFESVGYPVIKLERTSIGGLKLEGLEKGRWRHLNNEEIKYLTHYSGKPTDLKPR
ncbi:MAG: pseudouridine synthase [Bacillota bacterium]|nr:pseudouridine synthase [Bacillota bacterium]